MIKGLFNASISMQDKIHNIQIVANNLANLNTNGYKREIPFSEYMKRNNNVEIKQLTDFSEGEFIETGNKFDLAISGDAFFEVKTERGYELTKNGQFEIDGEGFLTTKDGNRVMGENGEINISEAITGSKGEIVITKEGEIKIDNQIVDSLRMVTIEDPKKLLRSENQKYFDYDENYIKADVSKFQIHQGFLESSNTNPILEMQAMIQLQKDFEASQKMVQSLDTMLSLNKEIGRV